MNWRYTFTVGFGFFGISIIWPIFNSLIPPMLEDLGLSAAVIGFILTWDNIINMFVQPWVGEKSDHTWTRLGRRKPWLLLGAPMAALFFILCGSPWRSWVRTWAWPFSARPPSLISAISSPRNNAARPMA